MKNFIFGGDSDNSVATSAGLAFLRIFAGLSMAFGHGIKKLPPAEGFVGAVKGMGFPAPELFAWAAALSEFGGGILLALGLATRLSSLMVFGTMVVAFAGVHLRDPFEKQEMALLYLVISLLFVLRGAGSWSIDALIRGKR